MDNSELFSGPITAIEPKPPQGEDIPSNLPPLRRPEVQRPLPPSSDQAPAAETPKDLGQRLNKMIRRASIAAVRLGDDYRNRRAMNSDPRTILQRKARRRQIFAWHEGLLWKALGKSVIRGIAVGVLGVSATTAVIHLTNPPTADILSRTLQAETSLITDESGILVQEIVAPGLGRRTEVPLNEVSPNLIYATVATEDKHFWKDWKVDLGYGISRAVWQFIQESWQAKRLTIVSGGSTIAQQVGRNLYELHYLFDQSQELDGPAGEFVRKAREIVLAAEINRNLSKEEILELYLNNIYYGYGAYGVEAASQTFFGKSAKELTLMESAFLAGNTQGPEIYDPYNNREVVNERVRQVLGLVKNNYGAESCSGVTEKACYTYEEIEKAGQEIENYRFQTPPQGYDHKAWVDMVEGQLHDLFPGDSYYTAGVNVKTTIDTTVQKNLDDVLASTSATDSVVVWGQDGSIQAIGGDVFPDKIIIRTPDGDFSLLKFVESFELSRGNNVILHAIDKITKIKNGKVVAQNPPLVNKSLDSAIIVDQSSIGETVTLPDGSSAIIGYSQSADGFRYNWIIGEKNGRNFIYWTSDKDPQTALLTFQEIINRINSGMTSQVGPDSLVESSGKRRGKSPARPVLPGANIFFDQGKGEYVLEEPPISARTGTLPGYTVRDLGREEYANQKMLLELQNPPPKIAQIQASQNAQLRQNEQRARNIPRNTRGRV